MTAHAHTGSFFRRSAAPVWRNWVQRPGLDLYKRDRSGQPLDDVIERMRTRDVKIQIASLYGAKQPKKVDGATFAISFAYPDRYKAKAGWRRWSPASCILIPPARRPVSR